MCKCYRQKVGDHDIVRREQSYEADTRLWKADEVVFENLPCEMRDENTTIVTRTYHV